MKESLKQYPKAYMEEFLKYPLQGLLEITNFMKEFVEENSKENLGKKIDEFQK